MRRSPATAGQSPEPTGERSNGPPVRYVRATVSYDGTDFVGFQWQSRGRTVQGELERALAQVCGIVPAAAPSRVIASGRTDAGVHALGQVIGFQTTWRHPLDALGRALNAVLAADVAVEQIGPAEPDWHPRFSATRRIYRYTVLNQPVRSPLDRRYALHVEKPLDVGLLSTGAQHLVGEHDFASFGQPMVGSAGEGTTVRHIYEAAWTREGAWVRFVVSGNAFLRGMVRNIVGTLLQVGMEIWPPERVAEILALQERAACAAPAPACGLCLMQVDYE